MQTVRTVDPEEAGQQIEDCCRQERQEYPHSPETERQETHADV